MILFQLACKPKMDPEVVQDSSAEKGIQLVVLGTVQDGGAPHIGCKKACCERLWENPDESLKVVSLGVVDFDNDKVYMFEDTARLISLSPVCIVTLNSSNSTLSAIF